jgi:hypothetical protein
MVAQLARPAASRFRRQIERARALDEAVDAIDEVDEMRGLRLPIRHVLGFDLPCSAP